jgi:hypothetical protein
VGVQLSPGLIVTILVLQTGQVPSVAGRPFFIVTGLAWVISRVVLHFMHYAVAGAAILGVELALAIVAASPGLTLFPR